MRDGDKELLLWLAAIFIVIILYLLWRARQPDPLQNAASGIPGMSPYDFPVAGFPPTSITGGNYDINVPNPTFAWLSPYFPLFGFVGVASSQIYQ